MYSIFDEIDRIFNDAKGWYYTVPPGYKLVEDPGHKKRRVEESINATKNMITFHEGQIKQLQDKLSSQEQELLSLPP